MVEEEERENAAERERRWKSEEDVMSAEAVDAAIDFGWTKE